MQTDIKKCSYKEIVCFYGDERILNSVHIRKQYVFMQKNIKKCLYKEIACFYVEEY